MATRRSFHSRPARLVALSLAVGMAAVSCTGNAPPAKSDLNLSAILPDGIRSTEANGGTVVMSSPGVVVTGAENVTNPLPPAPGTNSVATVRNAPVVAQPKPLVPKEEIVVPPKEAKWTLFCTVIGGPGHIERAKQIKIRLAESTKSNKWYVVHEDDKSMLYYGFYRTIDRGTKDGDAAQADKASISGLRNAAGDAPMQLCSFMTIDTPGPEAPAEWDMGNMVRSPEKYWSLQIAAFTADASDAEGHDRKWAAVESVKALRAQGLPAYFYHGDSISSVCVGVWPEGAVKKQKGANGRGDAAADNPDTAIVVSNFPLPEKLPNGLMPKDQDGRPLKSMSPQIELLDPTLHAMATRFPSHMVNSEERQFEVLDPVTKQKRLVSLPSFLVFIPEAKSTSGTSGPHPAVNPGQLPLMPPSLLQTNQPLPPQPGVGRLREVGN